MRALVLGLGLLKLHTEGGLSCSIVPPSAYLVNGGDVFSLQRMLGHTTLDMVKRYVRWPRATSLLVIVPLHRPIG